MHCMISNSYHLDQPHLSHYWPVPNLFTFALKYQNFLLRPDNPHFTSQYMITNTEYVHLSKTKKLYASNCYLDTLLMKRPLGLVGAYIAQKV